MTNKQTQQNTPSVICGGRRPKSELACARFQICPWNSLENGCRGTILSGNVLIPGNIARAHKVTGIRMHIRYEDINCMFLTTVKLTTMI